MCKTVVWIHNLAFHLIIILFYQHQTLAQVDDAVPSIISFDIPIDANKVTKSQLLELNIFSNQQIDAFISYRREYGQLLGLEELQIIPYWDNLYLKIDLERFFRVKYHKNITDKRMILWTQYKIKWKGNTDNKYDNLNAIAGLSNKRIHGIYRTGKGLGIGVDLESDKEEKGIDHYSFFVDAPVRDKWRFSVGNHQILMSDQLVFGRQSSLRGYGSGVEAFYWMPKTTGIIPVLHTETTLGYNGLGILYNHKRIAFNSFVYYNKRDMSPHPIINNAGRSIKLSGIHTTDNQLSTKNNLIEYGTCHSIGLSIPKLKYKGTIWHIYRKWDYPLTYKPFTVYNSLTDFSHLIGFIKELKILQGIFIIHSIWSQKNGWGHSFQYLRPFTRYFSLGLRGQWHNQLIEMQTGQVAQRYLQTRIEFNRRKKWFYILQLTNSEKKIAVKEKISYWKQNYFLSHQTQWGRTYRKTLSLKHQLSIKDVNAVQHRFTIDARIYKTNYNLRSQLYVSEGWAFKNQAFWKNRKIKLGLSVTLYNTKGYNDRIYFVDQNTDFARQLTLVYGRGTYTSLLIKLKIYRHLQLQTLLTRNCRYEVVSIDKYLDTRQCNHQVAIKMLWRD